MGNGYLGKISAIVTANTADFQAKLEGGAASVRKFSREVQTNITKAMGDAEKSIQSIYTPLQRLEGSLKAAGSLKLSFKGFAGAIKDVEDLKSRLGSLNDQQVKIVLDQSGLSSLKEVRSVLREFSNRDIRIFDAAGSLQDLQKIQAGLSTARGQRKLAKLGIDESELDALIDKFRRIPPQKIKAVIDVLGKDMLDSSFSRARQLFSLTEQINKPLMAAVESFGALSREVQAGFNPALGKAQNRAQALADDIKSTTLVGEARFQKVEESVQRVTVAIKQLSEASSLVGSLKTGRELAFDQPGLNAALTRAAKFGNDAQSQMAVSGIARANSGDVSRALQQIMAESKRAEAILAELKSAEEFGLSGYADKLRKDLADVANEINKVIDAGETKIDLQVKTATAKAAVDQLAESLKTLQAQADFTITGKFQDSQQTVAAIQEIIGMMGKLDAAQKGQLQRQLNLLITTAKPDSTTGAVDLDRLKLIYDALKEDIEKGIKTNIKTEEDDKKLDSLRLKIREIGEKANFSLSGRIQNPGQAEAEIDRIVGSLGRLNAAGKAAVMPRVGDALRSLRAVDADGNPDINAMRAAYKALKAEFDKQLDIKVNADKAKTEVEKLRAALASIADSIGEPAAPIDRLRKAVDEASVAIKRLDAADPLRGKLEGDLNQLKGELQAGSNPDFMPMTPGQMDAAAMRAAGITSAAAAGKPTASTKGPNDLGPDFGTSERRLLSLRASVGSLQGEMEKLPLPLQAKFIPAINKVREAFQKLDSTSSSREIDVATKKAEVLGKMLQRAGQGAKFGGTIGDVLNEAAITKTERQLGFIRSKLLEVGATASGPVANAFNAYAAAASAASEAGTIGTAATTRQLNGLVAKLGEALVAEGKLTAVQGKAFSKNVGDVGRGGADKFSLALNQAAFAADDFMSSTGGLEFKLRAVSNNITQLGFVIGGTFGLFVGLGAVIAGQVAVGLIKWANDGRSAEDQTKALNDALARQKSLVEDLVQAFRSLGDAMSQGTFSAGGDQAAKFARQLEDIEKKQKDVRESRVADLDKNVQVERAEQVKLKSQLEKSIDPSERVVLQRRLNASSEREKEASVAAVNRKVDPGEARTRIRESMERVRLSELDPRGNDIRTFEAKVQEIRAQASRDAEAVPVGNSSDDIKAQRAALDKELEGLSKRSKNAGRFFMTDEGANAARDAAIPLEQLLKSLDLPLLEAIDEAANKIAEASRGPAVKIRQAQEDVADAIKRGVPAAGAFQRELDSSAEALKEAYAKLEEAQNEKTPDKKQAKVDQAQANIARVEEEMAGLDARARRVRLGRTYGGERSTAALAAIGGERFANQRGGATARLQSAIDAETQAMENLEAATAKGVFLEVRDANARLEGARKASQAAAAFAEATAAIENAISRIRKIGESALQKSEAGADAAQKAFEENPQRGGGAEARDAAENRLINDRAVIGDKQGKLDNRRREIQNNPEMVAINAELEGITQRRKDLAAKADIGGGLGRDENSELDAATKREIELIRQRELLARQLTEAERKQLDVINNGLLAREKELEKSRQRSEESPEFNRTKSQAEATLGEASRRADEAQQRFAANPTDENKKRRDDAESQLQSAQGRLQQFQDLGDLLRKQAEASPEFQANNAELQGIAERRSQIASDSAGRGLTQEEAIFIGGDDGLIARESELRAKNEQLMQKKMAPQRKAVDDAQKEEALLTRADRGRDLGMTDRDRFAKEFKEGSGADINARADQMRRGGEDPTAFLEQAFKNEVEKAAPMFKQFEEDRKNAQIQGPSRAALNMSDVSSREGASELTRLLRGDDSAKDVNLAELRKQNDNLQTIADLLRDANPGVLL
jgi:hypothetical protein